MSIASSTASWERPLPPATDTSVLPLTGADDAAIRRIMAEEGLRLVPGEVRRMLELLKRDPTRVEATIFDGRVVYQRTGRLTN